MRVRAIGSTLALTAVLAMMSSPASARTLETRTDRNDTTGTPDIRKVSSNILRRSVVVALGAWGRLRTQDEFAVILDTRGDRQSDRLIDVVAGACEVYRLGAAVKPIGDRDSRRLDARTRGCRLPKAWFDITKPVRFAVQNSKYGFPRSDRAPDRAWYLGL